MASSRANVNDFCPDAILAEHTRAFMSSCSCQSPALSAPSYLQRYFIIVASCSAGAWTIIVGAMALVGDRAALAGATAGNVWVADPLDPAPGRGCVPIAWLVLSLIGVGVQTGITGGDKGRVVTSKK
jgi:hypothetical protein